MSCFTVCFPCGTTGLALSLVGFLNLHIFPVFKILANRRLEQPYP